MDSYEILGVSKDSSDKEIEVAYKDLKSKYDPSFNTSISAYKKYREIVKAYENIRDENRRKMYNLREDNEVSEIKEEKYKLYDFSEDKEVIKEEINEDLDYVREVVKEDIIINRDISYLYYLLNLRDDIEYSKIAKCDSCKEFSECKECNGVGVVYYKEKQVYCPRCYGKGKVSNCLVCDDLGYYSKRETVSVYVSDFKEEIKGLGNEYFDGSKSNLVINYHFYDKENIEVSDEVIKVNYYLNKSETLNGIDKEFYNELGAFKLKVNSFVNDGETREIIFNNKKIIFSFYNEKMDGKEKVYYLLISKKDRGSIVYFNSDYSDCSKEKSDIYFNEIEINGEVVIDGLGEKGKYGGNNGNLVINCEFVNKDIFVYSDKVSFISSSLMFNLLGGNINGVRHYGFRGSNALIKKNNGYYLFSGESKEKRKLKDYFLFRVLSLVILFVTPCLLFLIPYSELMFLVMIVTVFMELVVINGLMEVNV